MPQLKNTGYGYRTVYTVIWTVVVSQYVALVKIFIFHNIYYMRVMSVQTVHPPKMSKISKS